MDIIKFIEFVSQIILIGAAFLQVIFIYLSFKLAGNYLSTHKSKLKAENQEKYVLKLLEILIELENNLGKVISNEMSKKEKIDYEKNLWQINERKDILFPFLKNFWVKERWNENKTVII